MRRSSLSKKPKRFTRKDLNKYLFVSENARGYVKLHQKSTFCLRMISEHQPCVSEAFKTFPKTYRCSSILYGPLIFVFVDFSDKIVWTTKRSPDAIKISTESWEHLLQDLKFLATCVAFLGNRRNTCCHRWVREVQRGPCGNSWEKWFFHFSIRKIVFRRLTGPGM